MKTLLDPLILNTFHLILIKQAPYFAVFVDYFNYSQSFKNIT